MDLEYLEKLIKLFETSELSELEIDEEDSRITLSRNKGQQPMQFSYAIPPSVPSFNAPQQNQQSALQEGVPTAPAKNANHHEVKSPIVGTFYRAPAPDADSYVQIGQQVNTGTTLCIIEAMKLMNEIESDATGKVIKIMVEDGQPVEYGQVLMILEQA